MATECVVFMGVDASLILFSAHPVGPMISVELLV